MILSLEREKEPEGWKQMHVGGTDGIGRRSNNVGCGRRTGGRTGGTTAKKRPTMYSASMDIKTAFDVAGPKRIAHIVGDQDMARMDYSGLATRNGTPGRTGDLRTCSELLFDDMYPSGERRTSSAVALPGNADLVINSAILYRQTLIGSFLTRRSRTWSRNSASLW